jgi:16S rRNA (adenine1518-N6/adenine1519-N6)-dimethyltransferase
MIDTCDIHQIQALLERHGFHFSKAKGQNFLTRSWVPERIVREAGIDRDCGVVEVGPGFGPLTQQLCRNAGRVLAIEVDRRLEPVLAETVGEFDNLSLVFDDVLKADLASLTQQFLPGLRLHACANLPYYITSPVLTRLLESKLFEAVTVMVQKEVAQRICAGPGSADYSAFSVFCQYYAEPRMLFDVPPDCFIPRPKVTSSVITLPIRKAPVCEISDEALFFKVVRASFAMRRKTLQNGLASGFPQLGKARIAELLSACGLPPTVRGETLGIEQFAAIANAMAIDLA